MKRDKLKILLLQIRDDPKVRREELESFARYSDLSLTQFSVLNVFDQPKFTHEVLKGFDALYVGGASEANVLEPEKYKFVKYCIDLMRHASEIELPTFASCFGFQLAILAFGGKVFSKDKNYEMGSVPIKLTNLAKVDQVFKGIPNNFSALSVHQQYALDLPKKLDLLAYTSDCLHSFKHRNAPFWAFQFHPEVDRDTVFTRLSIYKEKYTKSEKQFQNVLNSLVETPDSHKLMKNFVDRVLI